MITYEHFVCILRNLFLGCKVPKKIDSLQGKGVIKLHCGSQFSIALTNQGHLYTWCVYMCMSVRLSVCLSVDVCVVCVHACVLHS